MRSGIILFILALATAALFPAGMLLGSVDLPAEVVFGALTGRGDIDEVARIIVVETRLPAVVTSCVAGLALAVAGLLMQTAFANPLAGPSIMGISTGASLGVAVVLMAVVCLVGIFSCSSTLTALSDPFSGPSSSQAPLASDAIGIIELDGSIAYDGSLCSPEGLKAQLDRAEANDHIKAVVLRVNSGGGTATAGEEMAAYVRDFPKPVVVSSAAINASAAYEISSQADYIYVAQTTSIGSIGTALQVTNVGELLEKLGISVENITSADSKDASYGTRPLTEEERAYYQAMVDQINGTFIKAVAEGRGMSEAEVRKLATGLPFTGIDAVGNGLADELGSLEDAVAKAASLAGSGTDETVYLYASSSNISSLLDLMSESRNDGRASLGALAEEVAR